MKRLLLPAVAALILAAAPARADTAGNLQASQNAMASTAAQGNGGQGQDQSQKKHHTSPGGGQGGGNGGGNGQGPVFHKVPPPPVHHKVTPTPVVRHHDTTVIKRERYVGPHDYTPGHRPANWNVYPRHFDRDVYRHVYRAEHRYHWGVYVRPHGWYYRNWVFGQHLPRIFWASNYWITSYWMYGLAIPPEGYVWVRYGDDAILIDRETGEILQVIYGIFY